MASKYRIHEMAKDFGMQSKRIMDMLGDIGVFPKNHMQVLEPDQLNYLFDRLTAQTQTPDIQAALAAQAALPPKQKPKAAPLPPKEPEPEPAEEPKIEEIKAEAPKEETPKEALKPQAPVSNTPQTHAANMQSGKPMNNNREPQNPQPRPAQHAAQQQPRPVQPAAQQQPRPVQSAAQQQPRPAQSAAQQQPRPAQPAAQQQPRPAQPAAQQRPKPVQSAAQQQRGDARRQRFQTPVVPQKPKKVEKTEPKRPEQPKNTITLQGRATDNEPIVVTTADDKTKGHKIDTRGESVNLDRYDERIEKFVPDSVVGADSSKQKLTKKNTDKKPALSAKKRQEEADRMRKLRQEMLKKQVLKVMIPDEIAVGELAMRLKKTASDVIKQLMKLGIMASVSQFIDYDTAALVAIELGAKVEHEVIVTIEDRLIDVSEDREENLSPRDPVVVVMGHVDHGKTSLLDRIRSANVAAGEAGGITQHIGAYRVHINDRDITFIDTPGHEAFTSMRARGASITDVVILVVAADDGIMPQTVEAINHAKAAGAPIVVAINKIDKENAQPDRVLQQLTEYELVPEQWGGDTICCPISALKGEGIENLLEMVLLTADMLDLKANPDRAARGTVIEARLDRGRGPVATVLVQNGTLNAGDVIIAGTSVGHVRVMTDDRGERIEKAGPSVPAEIVGLSEVPSAGDLFYAVEDERMARELVEQRKSEQKEEVASHVQRVSLDSLFDYIKEGEMKELNIIVKADVNGTAEAVRASLEKLTNEEVRLRVIHAGVGAINESDVMLANASNAIIVGFNVRPSQAASDAAELAKVDVRLYRVIYDCLEEMEAAMKGMLAPKYREVVLGRAQVRQVYKITGVGAIAGCYVQSGKVVRSAKVRIVRDGIVILEGEMASLKRFKDDAKEVAQGYECGIGIEKFNDIKVDDVIEAFTMEEIKQ
ncbi:MAG: translation initiation factor IF-2 [Clostridiaceae bacterium]|nr:translation initiation factor IF-2 [Clostridiaceae bacterium]